MTHSLHAKSLLIPRLSIHAVGWHLPAIGHILTILLLGISIHLIPLAPLVVVHLTVEHLVILNEKKKKT